MKEINYEQLINNLESMINALEYDSMRGSGKAKMNAGTIESMYNQVDRYKAKLKSKPGPKPAKQEG